MKTYSVARTALWFASALSLKSLAAAPALPDLKISQVVEAGNLAYIRVVNTGMVAAGACNLRVYHSFGFGWFTTATPGVPGLAPGAGVWISVVNAGIAAPQNRYRVDLFNVVPELNELNNNYSTP